MTKKHLDRDQAIELAAEVLGRTLSGENATHRYAYDVAIASARRGNDPALLGMLRVKKTRLEELRSDSKERKSAEGELDKINRILLVLERKK